LSEEKANLPTVISVSSQGQRSKVKVKSHRNPIIQKLLSVQDLYGRRCPTFDPVTLKTF